MPELPEVETIKRGLQQFVVGRTIKEIIIFDPKIVIGDYELLRNATITEIDRIGKGLILNLDNGYVMAIHVKMTGQLIYRGDETRHVILSSKVGTSLPNTYTRVIFEFIQGGTLFYNDIRRFGWIRIIEHNQVFQLPFFKNMGPEPFKNLTLDYFRHLLAKFNSPVKSLLMDQSRIGGIGNIYANDALWVAGISPRRVSSSLTDRDTEALFLAIHEVMEFSIEHGAASDSSYVDALGQDGRYQEHFKVYGRAGQLCDRCGHAIIRIVLSGRGTFLCEYCQH